MKAINAKILRDSLENRARSLKDLSNGFTVHNKYRRKRHYVTTGRIINPVGIKIPDDISKQLLMAKEIESNIVKAIDKALENVDVKV